MCIQRTKIILAFYIVFLCFFSLYNFSFAATNIVTNGTFTPSSTSWTIVANGGNGCAFNTAMTTSYDWCIVSQTIDLASTTGYSTTQLDTAPPMTFSLQYRQRGDKVNTKYFIEVKLLAANGTTVITSSLYGSQASPLTISSNYDQWNTVTSNFSNYGPGVRYVSIKFGGEDGSPNWGGHYGPAFTNVSLSLDDTSAPTVSSLNPADNTTGVSTTSNLTITFNEIVDAETGNIIIKKASDDSIFETIDVTSGNVTGSGSTTITINPTSNFDAETDYYVLIDATAFDDTASNSYTGITATSTWNFTTEDLSTPTLSNITAYTSSNGAIITWDTNENTSALINYGLTASTTATTTELDTSPRDTSHSVSVSGLVSCTRYYYKAQSTDINSNTGYSSVGTFKTTGCTGDSTITATGQDTATSDSGGTFTQNTISIIIPASFKDSVDSAIFQANKLDDTSFSTEAGAPSSLNRVGTDIYTLRALTDENTNISTFDSPISITMSYTDDDIGSLDESSLWIYRYDGSSWHALSSCVVDQNLNTVTCETSAFSDFALFGDEEEFEQSKSSSGGISIKGRIKNLISMGKEKEAEELKNEWSHLFNDKKQNATSTINNNFNRDLTLGLSGEDVTNLQLLLIKINMGPSALELARVGATGYFGNYTKNALGEWQKSVGIIPWIGYFGPITRAYVNTLGNI